MQRWYVTNNAEKSVLTTNPVIAETSPFNIKFLAILNIISDEIDFLSRCNFQVSVTLPQPNIHFQVPTPTLQGVSYKNITWPDARTFTVHTRENTHQV